MQWKDFLYFNRRQRRGVLVLLSLILMISVGVKTLKVALKSSYTDKPSSSVEAKFKAFKARQKTPDPTQVNVFKAKELKIKASFDPNTGSQSELIELGLPKHLVQNILHYREAGGRFRSKADLKKLYTMTPELFDLLESFINIKPSKSQLKSPRQPSIQTKYKKFPTQQKYTAGTVLPLNSCDTTELQKVPGIGSYTAQKISKYRNRLGGFYSTNQLLEIGIDAKIVEWFSVDSTRVNKIALNDSSFQALVRHPYLSYEQVKSIFNFKRKQGKIKSIKQLQLLEAFDANSIERITPYLSFN